MTRPTRRDVERRLNALAGDDVAPPAWFREWHGGRSDEWIREQWADVVREAARRGADPHEQAWLEDLKRASHR